MHLVDACAFYTPFGGGVKTYIDAKLKILPEMGHKVTIIVPGEDARVEERGPNAQLLHIPSPAFPLDKRYRYFDDEAALHAALDSLSPDVVEVSSPWSSATKVANWQGSAVRAMIMHADPLSAYAYRWFDPLLPRKAIDRGVARYWRHLHDLDARMDIILCANSNLTKRMQAGGLQHVATNAMGVSSSDFSPDLRDEALRAELLGLCDLPSDATLLIGIGRMASEKRWPMIMDGVRAVGANHGVGLLLIGDGPARQSIQRARKGNPHIKILRPVTDRHRLATIFASADALVHGCEAETFGMVAAEARASGLPMIIPDEGGAVDQLVSGAGGLFRAGDKASLVETLQAFLISDQAQARARAKAAAKHPRMMRDHFVDLIACYEKLMQEK